MIRQAISPRLAIRMRLNMPRRDPCPATACEALRRCSRIVNCGPRASSRLRPAVAPQNNLLPVINIARHPFFRNASAKQSILNLFRSLGRTRRALLYRAGWRVRPTEDFMALALNDTAPDFEGETTEGRIKFHDWIGDKWAVLFSHPKDFTPVCTTELGYMAKIKPEFDKRGVKVIGLSVDPVDRHSSWAADIKETQGTAPNYPMIGDTDFNVSKLYGMLPAAVSSDPLKRSPADNQTVRNVFVIGPDKKIRLILVYPMTTGRNFDEVLRVIDSLQMTAKHKVSTPAQWKQGEDVIISGSVNDEDARKLFPGGWKSPKPYMRIVPQPQG